MNVGCLCAYFTPFSYFFRLHHILFTFLFNFFTYFCGFPTVFHCFFSFFYCWLRCCQLDEFLNGISLLVCIYSASCWLGLSAYLLRWPVWLVGCRDFLVCWSGFSARFMTSMWIWQRRQCKSPRLLSVLNV